MHDLPSACLRCSAPSRLFHTTVDQVVLLCSDKEVCAPRTSARVRPCVAPPSHCLSSLTCA